MEVGPFFISAMKALFCTQTEDHFIFSVGPSQQVEGDGVMIKEGTAWFSRDQWDNVNKCMEWLEDKEDFSMPKPDKDKVGGGSGLYHFSKDLTVTTKKTLEITGDDWALMQKYMVRPENIKKDALVIYEDGLANNFVDRDRERFPKSLLENFSRTMPGKTKMIGHGRSEPGIGTYYKSELNRVSVDEAIEIVKLAGDHPNPDDFKAMLIEVEKRDGGIFWLVATFYMFADDPIVKYIDAGIKKTVFYRIRC